MSKKTFPTDLRPFLDQLLELIRETPPDYLLEWAEDYPEGIAHIQAAFAEYDIEISYAEGVHFWHYASENWNAQWLYGPDSTEIAQTMIIEVCEALQTGFSPILQDYLGNFPSQNFGNRARPSKAGPKAQIKSMHTYNAMRVMLNDSRKINIARPEKPLTNRGPIVRPKKGH